MFSRFIREIAGKNRIGAFLQAENITFISSLLSPTDGSETPQPGNFDKALTPKPGCLDRAILGAAYTAIVLPKWQERPGAHYRRPKPSRRAAGATVQPCTTSDAITRIKMLANSRSSRCGSASPGMMLR